MNIKCVDMWCGHVVLTAVPKGLMDRQVCLQRQMIHIITTLTPIMRSSPLHTLSNNNTALAHLCPLNLLTSLAASMSTRRSERSSQATAHSALPGCRCRWVKGDPQGTWLTSFSV